MRYALTTGAVMANVQFSNLLGGIGGSYALQSTEVPRGEPMIVLRNVAGHDWGFFTREDPRMHIQTMEEGARKGPKSAKVWLERDGARIFEATGPLSGKQLKNLEEAVADERTNIETKWINMMIKNQWLTTRRVDSIVTLTAYPTHNSFKRMLDLRKEFPAMYSEEVVRPWTEAPPRVALDDQYASLLVGDEPDPDDRVRIDLTEHIFVD